MSLNWRAGDEPVPGYRLVERLGRGGFGEVWKAEGPGGFLVALKGVSIADARGNVELRSLDVIREVRHPLLVAIFGTWQEGDLLVIAMELAERTLLDRFLEAVGQGFPGIPAPEIHELFHDAARGLDYLHAPKPGAGGVGQPGIQHRDIKPQNLLLMGGSLKVADYGLARVMAHSQASHTGGMTPAYAAPEFFKGKTSSQSDQYSLAVTYCHMRGGRPPFSGEIAEVVAGHLGEEPDLSMLPVEERPAVARALSKAPKERWPTCRAFVEAVRAATVTHLDGPEGVGPTVTYRGRRGFGWFDGQLADTLSFGGFARRRRLALAVAGGLLLLVLAIVAVAAGPRFRGSWKPPAAPPEKFPIPEGIAAKGAAPAPAPAPAAAALPGPTLAIHAPAAVEIGKGESRPIEVTVDRGGFEGSVAIRLVGLPAGASPAEESAIPAGSRALTLHLAIPYETPLGDHVVRVQGRRGDLSAESRMTVSVLDSSRSYYEKGKALLAGHNPDGAIASLDEAVRLDPGNDRAIVTRAYARMEKKDYDRAIADFTEVIALRSRRGDLGEAYSGRSFARLMKKDMDGAIADADEVVRLRPNWSASYQCRATLYLYKGDKAKEAADQAIANKLKAEGR